MTEQLCNSEPACQQKDDTYDIDLSLVLGCIMERVEGFIELMAVHCDSRGCEVSSVEGIGIAMLKAANEEIDVLIDLIWEKIGPIDVFYKRGRRSSEDKLIDVAVRA